MDELAMAAPPTVAPPPAADAEHESKHSSGADYVICWRSMDTGRIGRGVRPFVHAEAERLCAQLNQTNPSFEHWPEPAAKERAHVEIAQG